MPKLKRAVKDSVFSFLFHEPEYLRQLYVTLHPEDSGIEAKDIKLITIENVLVVRQYNDLGLLARDKLFILTEAQAVFSKNVAIRLLMYLAETYKEYLIASGADLYSAASLELPAAELYVVYTGDRESVPDVIRLSELFMEGTGASASSGVELCAKVLRADGSNSIIDQYIQFCMIVDEQRKQYGYTQEAIDEAVRICRERGVLRQFLTDREKEVHDIMFTLFSQEELTALHERALVRDSEAKGEARGIAMGEARGIAKGKAEGVAKGSLDTTVEMLRSMMKKMSCSADYAMDLTNVSAEMREKVRARLASGDSRLASGES